MAKSAGGPSLTEFADSAVAVFKMAALGDWPARRAWREFARANPPMARVVRKHAKAAEPAWLSEAADSPDPGLRMLAERERERLRRG
ncbi:MAG TPA: hypothetical protein VGI64_17820 [Streptosporangiaceae bacterium]